MAQLRLDAFQGPQLDLSKFQLDTSKFGQPEPEEDTNPLTRFWRMLTSTPDAIRKPLTSAGDSLTNATTDESFLGGRLQGFAAGAMEGVGDLLTPLNIASFAHGGPIGNTIGRIASLLTAGEGTKNIVTGDNPLMGAAQVAGGLLGTKKIPNLSVSMARNTPEVLPPLLPSPTKLLPPIGGESRIIHNNRGGIDAIPNPFTGNIRQPTVHKNPLTNKYDALPAQVGDPNTIDIMPAIGPANKSLLDTLKKQAKTIITKAPDATVASNELRAMAAVLPETNPIKSKLMEIVNLPRAVMSTEITPISSAALRQGFPLIHTKAWWTSWSDMVKSYGSEKAFRASQESVLTNPLFKSANDAGVKFTDVASDMTKREEDLMSSWAEKIGAFVGKPLGVNPIRASNRGYTAYLNKLRMGAYKTVFEGAKSAGLDPDNNKVLANQIASYINNASGRGDLGRFEKIATELNSTLFSPRNLASRLQMINPKNYVFQPAYIRKQYWKSLGGITAAWTTMAGLGKLAGAEVSLDPRNSDFGKMKIGNSRIDPAAGFQQEMVLLARFIANQSTSSTSGETTDMGSSWNSPTRGEQIQRFGSNKLNPPTRFIYDWMFNSPRNKFDPKDELVSMTMPMAIKDLMDVFNDDPSLLAIFAPIALGLPGMGIQTYGGR